MHLAEQIAVQRFGAWKITLLTGKRNLFARAFYDNQGFHTDNEIHYAKEIRPPVPHS